MYVNAIELLAGGYIYVPCKTLFFRPILIEFIHRVQIYFLAIYLFDTVMLW